MDAFFLPEPDGTLVATPWTRGPWDVRMQHGGPPSALLARSIDRAIGDEREEWIPVRTVVELLKPVPIARLRPSATIETRGRQAIRAHATLEHDEVTIARAHAILVRAVPADPEMENAEARRDRLPPPESWPPMEFSFFPHPVGYHRAIEGRMEGEWPRPRARVWSRIRVPLVLGEPTSGWERVLTFADANHGVAPALDPHRFTIVNPDLEVSLTRRPRGEWIALDVETQTTAIGTGMTRSRVFDDDGEVGASSAPLIVRRRSAT